MFTELGNRMKSYEMQTQHKFMPYLPVCVRLDGRRFSAYTKFFDYPYDERLARAMVSTTKYLVRETGAVIGYTQSDEISLILYSDCIKSQLFFDGKLQKIVSILAAMCSTKFNEYIMSYTDDATLPIALFDCRAWQVPTRTEAANMLVWREMDATKNSVSMAATTVYSNKQLKGKKHKERVDMLMDKGINWSKYPTHFKRGTYIRKLKITRPFTPHELRVLPPLHEAHTNPDAVVTRTPVGVWKIPPICSITNKERAIFEGHAVEIQQP